MNSSKNKPNANAIAALKERLRIQKAKEAATRLANEQHVQREREEKERIESEAAATLAHKAHLADLRAQRREQDHRAGKLQTKGQRMQAEKNKAFVASLGSGRVMTSAPLASSTLVSTAEANAPLDMVSCVRAPICCLIAHVDAGKSTLLDSMCGSHAAAQEAGGITQQLRASHVTADAIRTLTAGDVHVFPGAWILDTPGHASFHSFRKRGTSVCDVALVVINIMHGIELTTHESIRALREAGVPLLLILNKVDKCYGWVAPDKESIAGGMIASEPMVRVLERQPDHVRDELARRAQEIANDLHHQHMIFASLCMSPYEEDEEHKGLPMVPISAKTGQGVGDVFRWLTHMTSVMTQLEDKVEKDHIDATVLEVRMSSGVGTVLDVLLVSGQISVGDTIVVAGWSGQAITTRVRALHSATGGSSTTQQESIVHGTACFQLVAPHMDQVVVGSRLVVLPQESMHDETAIETARTAVMHDVTSVLSRLVPQGKPGILLHASTLGALEAALDLLSQQQVPVASIAVGPVTRSSIQRAMVILESSKQHCPELATILAFDTTTHKDAAALAHESQIPIFSSDILYDACKHLGQHLEAAKQARRLVAASIATYPVVLDVLPDCIFRTKVGETCAARSHRVRRFAPCACPISPFHPASYVIGCSSSPDT
jgi:translation initiation factor 5B